jgi:hypothetical protein
MTGMLNEAVAQRSWKVQGSTFICTNHNREVLSYSYFNIEDSTFEGLWQGPNGYTISLVNYINVKLTLSRCDQTDRALQMAYQQPVRPHTVSIPLCSSTCTAAERKIRVCVSLAWPPAPAYPIFRTRSRSRTWSILNHGEFPSC